MTSDARALDDGVRWVKVDEYPGDMSEWNGTFGFYSHVEVYRAKGFSIWVRTKPRFRTPMKVRPIYPNREIKLWRTLAP